MVASQSPGVNQGFKTMVEEIIFQIMIGIVKAEPNEPVYARFKQETRAMTEAQLRHTARSAAEFYVEKANPSLGKLSREEVRALQNAAIAHALKITP